MRLALIATLALSPAMLSAQAITPAQPQAAAPGLQAKLVAEAPLSERAADRDTVVPTTRIYTGVVEPKLIYSVNIPSEANVQWRVAGAYRSAIVEILVDKTGKPSDLKMLQSAGRDLDQGVLSAVSQYRFQPATVNSVPVPWLSRSTSTTP